MKKISIGIQDIILLSKKETKNILSFGKPNEVYCLVDPLGEIYFVLNESKKDIYKVDTLFELAYLYAIDNFHQTSDIVLFKGTVVPALNKEYMFTLKVPKEEYEKIPKGIMQKFSNDIKVVFEM